MRLIDADALPRHGNRGGLVHWKDIKDAPTVDTVEVVRQAFSGEMKLMPAEDATLANPYKTVLEDLKQVAMFTGRFDAKNGNKHFMFGILAVMEYIADKAGNKEYVDMFLDNMNKSVYGDKAE